ncbi:MAG: response regulator transcription factor [Erysipelotrichaceae bacterium]|nr:response regulator transcription factor [Erysipelotrichaceae bacterium]
MYKIACCDDDTLFLNTFRRMADDIFRRSHIEYQLDTYVTFDSLYEACFHNTGRYDLLVLDVLISEGAAENGISWGQKLREHGVSSSILFVSSSRDYILDGYDVQALRYLLKPVDPELLEKILLKDYNQNHLPQRVILTKGSSVTSVYLRDILYVESIQRTTLIHTKTDTVSCNLHLDHLITQLASPAFVRCHQSYIVNLSHVTMIQRYQAVLSNHCSVPISKSYFKNTQREFIHFLCDKV